MIEIDFIRQVKKIHSKNILIHFLAYSMYYIVLSFPNIFIMKFEKSSKINYLFSSTYFFINSLRSFVRATISFFNLVPRIVM